MITATRMSARITSMRAPAITPPLTLLEPTTAIVGSIERGEGAFTVVSYYLDIIGASLSEPHINGTSMHELYIIYIYNIIIIIMVRRSPYNSQLWT